MNRIKRTKISFWGALLAAPAAVALLALPAANAAPDTYTQVKPATHDSNELPAVGTITRQFSRVVAGQPRVAVVSGVLTAPSADAAESVGAAYLARRPDVLGGAAPADMTLAKVIDLKVGQALRYRQTFQGLPVYGGTTVVRLDEQMRVRWAGSNARQIPGDLSIQPTISAREALAAAARQAGYDQPYIDRIDLSNAVQLAIFSQPNMPAPRLAYWIEMPQDLTRMAVYRGFVDAHTGHVYKLENRVVHGALPTCDPGTQRAYVYPANPVETPDLECVSLEAYLAPGATQLNNADIATGNCIDNNGCRNVDLGLGAVDVHWCDDDPVATAMNGDFLNHVFTDDVTPDDTFAEVQMFYHLNKAFDVARSLGGFINLNARPLGAVVNFQLPLDIATGDIGGLFGQLCLTGPPYTGGESLLPFDNAAFIPAGGLLGYPDTDGLVFGQGTSADFSYDGDVVYHEFGHALMNTVAPGLAFGIFDQYGYDPTPGGMHEGYADLMTLWTTDDPEVGEYTGTGLGVPDGYIRNMNNTNMCPRNLVGETHEDALPITGAIYEARTTIVANGGDKTTFDEAVFSAQQMFTENDNYETAAAKTVAEVEATMGTTHANALSAVLAERGISDCNNRVADSAEPHPLLLVGNLQGLAGVYPGPVQWVRDLPEGADSITLDIERAQAIAGLGGAVELTAVLKQGNPIMWSDTGNGPEGDYTESAVVTLNIDMMTGVGPGTVTLPGPFAPGTYYMQLFANGGGVFMRNAAISHAGGPGGPDAGPGGPDAGPAGPDAGTGGDPDDGCGCSVGESERNPAGGILLGLLGMLAVVLVRRRR